VAAYRKAFADLPVVLPVERDEVESAWHLFPVRLRDEAPVGRDEFIERMKGANIGTSVHFIPIHFHPYYREKYGWREGEFPVAEREYERVVSLPMHGGLSAPDAEAVVGVVKRALFPGAP
jgi:dTDP-4-amino-4,6-dideoxygalactose transaminase